MKKEIDIEKLENAEFEIDKEAFAPKTLHCSNCNIEMKKTEIEVQLDNNIFAKLNGFECHKCKKKYLGLEESKKLDKGMILSRALNKPFKMTRKLSFDGDNYILRIPKEFTHNLINKEIEIVPLGDKEFCASVE